MKKPKQPKQFQAESASSIRMLDVSQIVLSPVTVGGGALAQKGLPDLQTRVEARSKLTEIHFLTFRCQKDTLGKRPIVNHSGNTGYPHL